MAKLDNRTVAGEVSYGLLLSLGAKLALIISDDSDNAVIEIAQGDALSLSIWHHVAGTYNGAGTYKLYIDGNLVVSDGNGGATGTIHVGTGRLTIGARYNSGTVAYKGFFSGDIDNVMIYNTELTATEVLSLYTSGL